jgi:hypothetical protein
MTEEKPLDLEEKPDDTKLAVWKRRIIFAFLILLCVSFAAPTFGSCSGALGSGGGEKLGSFVVAGERHAVYDREFSNAVRGAYSLRAFFGNARADEEDDEEIWQFLVLDRVARAAGIHVPGAQITELLRESGFDREGRFDEDRFRSEMRGLAERGGVDREALLEHLAARLRISTWQRQWLYAFDQPPAGELFDAWKKNHVKVTTAWVAAPYDQWAAETDALPVTDADLQLVANLPEVIEKRRIGTRRSVEAIVLRVRDVTPERRTALEALCRTAGVFPDEQSLRTAAFRHFFSNRKAGGYYTKESWAALEAPAYDAAKKAYEKALAEWTALPEPRPGAAPVAPVDPLATWPADDPRREFEGFWEPRVRAELLAQEAVRLFLARAEREGKSFGDLLPEYAQYGFTVVTSPEPLDDPGLSTFPDGLGPDSEFASVVRTVFTEPPAGTAFAPRVHPHPVPTTVHNDRAGDRGSFGLRWTALVPAKFRDVTEVREVAESIVKARRRADRARQVLTDLRKAAEGESGDRLEALRKHAAAAGLEVQVLRRFNDRTWRPSLPEEGTTAESKARWRAARFRNRVQEDYRKLATVTPGSFRDPILSDDAVGAAFLTLVTDAVEPAPVEFTEDALRIEEFARRQADQGLIQEALGFEALRKRYDISFETEYQKRWDDRQKAKAEREKARAASAMPGR